MGAQFDKLRKRRDDQKETVEKLYRQRRETDPGAELWELNKKITEKETALAVIQKEIDDMADDIIDSKTK